MSRTPEGQSWDPGRSASHAWFVADLAAPAVELLAPRPGERILDLGCGDGALTARLAAAGCAVVGVDSGQAATAAARARGLDARLMNGAALTFEAEFERYSPMPRCTGCAHRTRCSPGSGVRCGRAGASSARSAAMATPPQ